MDIDLLLSVIQDRAASDGEGRWTEADAAVDKVLNVLAEWCSPTDTSGLGVEVYNVIRDSYFDPGGRDD